MSFHCSAPPAKKPRIWEDGKEVYDLTLSEEEETEEDRRRPSGPDDRFDSHCSSSSSVPKASVTMAKEYSSSTKTSSDPGNRLKTGGDTPTMTTIMASDKSVTVTRLWENIVDHNLESRLLKLEWCGTRREPTWESIHDIVFDSSGYEEIIDYLEAIQQSMDKVPPELTAWIEQLKDNEEHVLLSEKFNSEPNAERNIGFCCKICRCEADKKSDIVIVREVPHRYCCHKIECPKSDWKSPVQQAIETGLEMMENREDYYVTDQPTILSKTDLLKKVITVQSDETRTRNQLQQIDEMSQAFADPCYIEATTKFQREKIKRGSFPEKGRAVVLDMFCGIGGAVVALKRLKIDMERVVHVDIDPVACHVARFNHDHRYNPGIEDDGIKHVFDYHTFEEVEDHLDDIMEKYGPFDVIIGGPPCADYSLVNATRKGTSGRTGQYLPQFGKFITSVRNHRCQEGKPVFFLSENVVYTDKSIIRTMKKAYCGLPLLRLDAKWHSPCKRDRTYILNIPINRLDYKSSEAESSADLCLDDDEEWSMPATEVHLSGERYGLENLTKANTFMASKGRLDDARMMKVKKEFPDSRGGSYICGTFSITERERMMGFPENYVRKAVDELYKALRDDAFALESPTGTESTQSWMDCLDKKYHHFSGYPYKIEPQPEWPFFNVMMKPPKESSGFSFLNNDEYGKHLIGNTFSIPSVQYLLHNLQDMFASREYKAYDFDFPWPPHNCK